MAPTFVSHFIFASALTGLDIEVVSNKSTSSAAEMTAAVAGNLLRPETVNQGITSLSAEIPSLQLSAETALKILGDVSEKWNNRVSMLAFIPAPSHTLTPEVVCDDCEAQI